MISPGLGIGQGNGVAGVVHKQLLAGAMLQASSSWRGHVHGPFDHLFSGMT